MRCDWVWSGAVLVTIKWCGWGSFHETEAEAALAKSRWGVAAENKTEAEAEAEAEAKARQAENHVIVLN